MGEELGTITIDFKKKYGFMKNIKISKMDLNDKDERSMFKDIHESYKNYNKNKNRVNKCIMHDSFLKSKGIVEDSNIYVKCSDYILSNTKMVIKYSIEIYGTIVNIYFTVFDMNRINIYGGYEKKLKYIITVLYFLLAKKNTVKHLEIYLCLTPEKKKLPKNSIHVLDKSNCNSGLSMMIGTTKSIILVYREEEWFKVLIHELIHALHLDISFLSYEFLKSKIKKIYPIESEFNINETFTELLACILNINFCSFFEINNPVRDYGLYLKSKKNFLKMEQQFSIMQMNKILRYMGLTYEQLYFKKKEKREYEILRYLYKERTNVFCYYILKCVLLYHYKSFVKWCKSNNVYIESIKNTKLLLIFSNFIESIYKTTDFLRDITKQLSKGNYDDNLRMTIVELDI